MALLTGLLRLFRRAAGRWIIIKKLFKYRTAGVREYWVVDPERELVTIYNFEKDSMEEYTFDKDIPVGIYEGFSLKME